MFWFAMQRSWAILLGSHSYIKTPLVHQTRTTLADIVSLVPVPATFLGTILINSRLPLKDQWQDIETQVLDELGHRVKLFLTEWTTWHDDPFAALGHRRRLIDKAIKIVLPQFVLRERE